VGAANHDFNHNGVVGDMAALDFDFEVGQRVHQLLVKAADSFEALIVLLPRLIIVARSIAEGAEHAFKIVLVLQSNMLLDNCDASRNSVFWKGCAGHVHSQQFSPLLDEV
jgi:hypothetical protein